jgi:hypothetical protein
MPACENELCMPACEISPNVMFANKTHSRMPACESGSYSDARQNRGSVLLQRMESVQKLLTHVLSLKRGWYFDVEDRGQDHIYGASKRGRCIPGARSEEEQKNSVPQN